MLLQMNKKWFRWLDKKFTETDKKQVLRTNNLNHIPPVDYRRGGKHAYAEWAHVIGIFQTIIGQTLDFKADSRVLDVGCGTGLLGMSAYPYVKNGGLYVGLDVMEEDVEFCRKNYPFPNYSFIHLEIKNASYAQTQLKSEVPWPVPGDYFDLVTALSVWTHLNENDAVFYFKEISRVMKSGSKAIITFFYQDEAPELKRTKEMGRYHNTQQDLWIFSEKAYRSENWRTTPWARVPEDAIAITPDGLKKLCDESGLKVELVYRGNWREKPGVFFQDVIIFSKP